MLKPAMRTAAIRAIKLMTTAQTTPNTNTRRQHLYNNWNQITSNRKQPMGSIVYRIFVLYSLNETRKGTYVNIRGASFGGQGRWRNGFQDNSWLGLGGCGQWSGCWCFWCWCASCPLLVLLVLGAKQRARQPALIAFRSRCLLLLFLLSHYSSAREGLLRTGTPWLGWIELSEQNRFFILLFPSFWSSSQNVALRIGKKNA